MWYIGQQAAAVKFSTDFTQIFLVPMHWCKVLLSALIVRFLTKRFIGDYEANTGEFPFIHLLCETEETARMHALCPLHQRDAAIDPIHSSTCPPLSFSTGALYSRKVTLEGEEVSLQIQDTPCVALQVTNGGT